jgi:hypothetical protein
LKPQVKTEHLSLVGNVPANPSQESPLLENMDQLSIRARKLLLGNDLELSKVRPFFWSLVEAYVDRFQFYPFDVPRALLNYLELHNYPEQEVTALVQQIEKRYLEQHGHPLKKTTELASEPSSVESEISELRDSLKYAALLDEI